MLSSKDADFWSLVLLPWTVVLWSVVGLKYLIIFLGGAW